MRKTQDSSKTVWSVALSACADGEVTAEGLLDDHARAAGAARPTEALDHLLEHARRDCEIVQRVRSTAELLAERGVGGRSAVVAADVAEPLLELREDRLVEAAVLLDALAGARPELLVRPVRPCDPDDGHLEMSAPFHRVESGENLLVDEVAGGPEEDEGVGVRNVHGSTAHFADFSRWPPNP